MSIHVKWGKERLHVALPSPDPRLGAIRQSLAEYSQIPIEHIKLIYGGAIMKDDACPISVYGIKEGSTIHMVGSADRPPTKDAPSSTPKASSLKSAESDFIQKIQDEVHRIRSLVPLLDQFSVRTKSSPAPLAELKKEHMRLGELLLQCLLRLDALTPEGTWEEARSQRKGVVCEVQGMLDKLDDSWQNCRDNAN